MREEIRTNVLILGGGLAGTLAALAAQGEGAEVCCAFMDMPGRSGNSARAGGVFAALGEGFSRPEDSPEIFIEDIYRSGWFLSNPELVRAIAEDSGHLIRELQDLGVDFLEKNGRLAPSKIPGHSFPRAMRVPGGGPRLMATLGPLPAKSGALLLSQFSLLWLLKDSQGRIVGADLAKISSGEAVRVLARATVLAMGGLGDMYPTTTNSPDIGGTGYGAALEAGCRLRDMEFIQFTPTAMAYPPGLKGKSCGGMGLTFKEARITNSEGERFMARYAPDVMERAKRDILARAMHREIVEGRGSPHGGVYLDLTGIPKDALRDVIGEIMDDFLSHGFDMTERPFEIAPAVHSCMGGVAVRSDGGTDAEGLFAAGENTGGLHGANRLASGGLTFAGVMGIRAGRAAASAVSEGGRALEPLPGAAEKSAEPSRMLNDAADAIRRVMFESGGIEREAASIQKGLDTVKELREPLDAAPAGPKLLPILARVRRMRLTAEAMLTAMKLREESRGAHHRQDFPERDDKNWLANIFLSLDGEGAVCAKKKAIGEKMREMAEG